MEELEGREGREMTRALEARGREGEERAQRATGRGEI